MEKIKFKVTAKRKPIQTYSIIYDLVRVKWENSHNKIKEEVNDDDQM